MAKGSRLVSLEIRDRERYAYSDKQQGQFYTTTASIVIDGQEVALKDMPIPDDVAVQIVDLVKSCAIKQMTTAIDHAANAIAANSKTNLLTKDAEEGDEDES